MKKEILRLAGSEIPCFCAAVAIVGTGAAGYNAADSLDRLGVTDVLLVTEGRMMGTSRNTGSDKQTYYKLNMAGGTPDSVYDMARSLMRGGSMHGDIALTDAALSARCFCKLTELGVPFPMNEFGEYVGYRTDHDETTRATSCGPLTSRYMTEALERAVLSRGTPMLDGYRVTEILTENGVAKGLVAVSIGLITPENPCGIALISAGDIIFAVGGPSAIYADTVYPESQTTSLGVAFAAGAAGANLTESQYGIASVKFRWNLSGTYQQVLPRYCSTEQDGSDEREFLRDAFESDGQMLNAVFSKGYEWPFDPRKTVAGGSSRIDLAVFREKCRGRRVFLDYRQNPSALSHDFSVLSEAARAYLAKSDALYGTPIERLSRMNAPAAALFSEHGIDLSRERLEIAVSAQHCNGGLAVDVHRESTTLRHFYAVGECAGTFGVYRPGGSALNGTQADSLMAALSIAESGAALPSGIPEALRRAASCSVSRMQELLGGTMTGEELAARRRAAGTRMSACAAFLRNSAAVAEAIDACARELAALRGEKLLSEGALLTEYWILRDILQTQLVMLSAVRDYLADGGLSRGSYLVTDGGDALQTVPALDSRHAAFVQNTVCHADGTVSSFFEPVRPLPASEQWFETVWNRCRKQ